MIHLAVFQVLFILSDQILPGAFLCYQMQIQVVLVYRKSHLRLVLS